MCSALLGPIALGLQPSRIWKIEIPSWHTLSFVITIYKMEAQGINLMVRAGQQGKPRACV
jgi:hypothetical protein